MISINKFTRSRNFCFAKSILLITAFALPLLTSHPASAKGFKIGGVKQRFFGGICSYSLPKTQKYMLLIPFPFHRSEPVIAWININGKDFAVKQTIVKITNNNTKATAKYLSKEISITVDSQIQNTRKDPGDMYFETSLDRISIDYRGQTKVVNTTGFCAI